MRNYDEIKITTNSRVYKMSRRTIEIFCPRCRPNRGCNHTGNYSNSWKKYRNKQYKTYLNGV